MSPIGIAVLAVSMSIDAFAVAIGRGAAIGRPRLREALRTGVVFGVVEALTPIIGWFAGVAASRYIEAIDHWIAFVLLAGVGIHMIYQASSTSDVTATKGNSLTVLIATAIGTSLDAMAVGVSLAFLQANILVIAVAIGLATFVMSSGGMLVGRIVGARFGKLAEVVAGIALCGLGTLILIDHLSRA